MNAGDFDLVVDPTDGKAYYYFERVHSELICADLTEDYTDVTGYYSTHFPLAAAAVRARGARVLRAATAGTTSSPPGTTGYYPNPSEVAVAPLPRALDRPGDPHPDDPTRSSYQSQISLGVPASAQAGPVHRARRPLAAPVHRVQRGGDPDARRTVPPDGRHHEGPWSEFTEIDTSIADYVWLPFRFTDDGAAYLDWHDEWRIDDYA